MALKQKAVKMKKMRDLKQTSSMIVFFSSPQVNWKLAPDPNEAENIPWKIRQVILKTSLVC